MKRGYIEWQGYGLRLVRVQFTPSCMTCVRRGHAGKGASSRRSPPRAGRPEAARRKLCGVGAGCKPAPTFPTLPCAYGDGTSTGQLGAVAPLLSVQLMRPSGAALTIGEIGEFAAM